MDGEGPQALEADGWGCHAHTACRVSVQYGLLNLGAQPQSWEKNLWLPLVKDQVQSTSGSVSKPGFQSAGAPHGALLA